MPLLFVVTAAFGFDDGPPTNWPNNFPMNFEKASAPLTRGLRMGPLDIQFEKTTLAEVQQAIGAGRIAYKGDAAEAELWLCYTFSDAKSTGRLWISASGEMGGPEHLVGGIDATLDPTAVPTGDCPALPPKFMPMSFDHGIWLGMKGTTAAQILGAGSIEQGKWTVYGYLGKVPDAGCEPDGYDLSNYLMFENVKGVIRSIRADQVTSC